MRLGNKIGIHFLVVFLMCNSYAFTQIVTHFTPKDFTERGELLIYLNNGWEYQANGTKSWQPIDPLHLYDAIANEKGQIEGWLRFCFTVDSVTANDPLYMRFIYFGSASVFLNGKLVQRQNENSEVKTYDIKTLKIKGTQKNTLLIHIKDRKLGFPIYKYKDDFRSFKSQTVRLLNGEYLVFYNTILDKVAFFYHLWIIALAIFSFLFGILFFVNKRNTNLLYITLSNTLLCLAIYSIYVTNMMDLSFPDYLLFLYAFRVFYWSFIFVLILTVFKLIGVQLTKLIKFIFIVIIIISIAEIIIDSSNLLIVIMSMVFLFITSQVIRRIQFIKSAQWYVIIGLISTVFFTIIYNLMIVAFEVDVNSNFAQSTATGIALSFPISLFFYLSFRFREINQEVVHNANEIVRLSEEKRLQAESQQKMLKEEVDKQTIELRNSLQELKSTQAQLIQSEKMASLGELTAGIAHEIQNPLNFVNNFSEVSQELIDEMKVELTHGNYKDAEQIAEDVKENLSKIHHHGKRADAIVKGMLQHSRTSSGKKEPTDINALCDEYLRLAYHGLRAKDKSFNAKFETKFDPQVGMLDIIPQDIGRVLLNLINNAFYATDERKKKVEPGYDPMVIVETKKMNDSITIAVIDNGMGIPDAIKEKIFQPFFTTKPTGQGTGLGLSLSYDIITKGHNGELRCETKYLSDHAHASIDQTGTTFTILLPDHIS
jgi:signal transduction histidine kinase